MRNTKAAQADMLIQSELQTRSKRLRLVDGDTLFPMPPKREPLEPISIGKLKTQQVYHGNFFELAFEPSLVMTSLEYT